QATAHVVGNQVLVFGGQDVPGCEMELRLDGATWDSETGRWRELPRAPVAERRTPVVVGTGHGLLLTGGRDCAGNCLADGVLLDGGTGSGRALRAWPVRPRLQPSVAVDGDDVVLFGGWSRRPGKDGDDKEWFADGVWLDCQRAAVRAIPAGPLAPRQSANL